MKTSFLALTLICAPGALLVNTATHAEGNQILKTLEERRRICRYEELVGNLEPLTKMRNLVEQGATVDAVIAGKTLIAHALSLLPYPKELNGKYNCDFISYDRILSLLALGAPINTDEMSLFLPDVMPINYFIVFDCPENSYPHYSLLGAAFEAAVNGTLLVPSERIGLVSNFGAMIAQNINMQDNILQMTPLMWAAARGNIELAKQLISLGADLRKTDRWGYTALHFAVLNGHNAVVDLLLGQSSGLRLAKTADGKTPTDLALSANKSVEMLRILSKKR